MPLELGEDLLVRLADDVGQHVEPAPVGHPDDDLVQALGRARLQDLIEERDQRLAALQREAPLADVLRLQARLEGLGGVEPVEDVLLLVGRGFSWWRSTREAIQRRSSGSWMCMYSTPTRRQ